MPWKDLLVPLENIINKWIIVIQIKNKIKIEFKLSVSCN